MTAGEFSRIAVTGVGAVTALGVGVETMFSRLIRGERGLGPFVAPDGSPGIVAQVGAVPAFDPSLLGPIEAAGNWARGDLFALLAAREAVASAGAARMPLGLVVGTTTGPVVGLEGVRRGDGDTDAGRKRCREHFRGHALSSTAERVGKALGLAGPETTLCSACSSGAVAIGMAAAWIRAGRRTAVLAGGVDALCLVTLAGFGALSALSKGFCRPFDKARDGITLGEGAGFLLLESEQSARDRGARVLAWLSGFRSASESFHLTQPEPTGQASAKLVREACELAGLAPNQIDYVNAHGTGTRVNDVAEARALASALGDWLPQVWVSSNKGQLGHTLGAAGAIEAVVTVLSLERGIVPPTGGLVEPDPDCAGLRHVMGEGRQAPLRAALSTSYGFGGVGVALVFEAANCVVEARDRLPTLVSVPPDERAAFTDSAAALAAPSAGRTVPVISAVVTVDRGGDAPPWEPLAVLDPERSRRFDRPTALTIWGIERALEQVVCPAEHLGLVLGLTHGNVERTVAFLDRVMLRGVRFGSPAEFPHILPSSVSGNASLYAGARGPALGVCQTQGCVEGAFAVGMALIAASQARAIVVGATEVCDRLLDGPLDGDETVPCRGGEGGEWLVLEDGATAAQRGTSVPCGVAVPWWMRGALVEVAAKLPVTVAPDAQIFLTEGSEPRLVPLLKHRGLSTVRRTAVASVSGRKTIAGGRTLVEGVSEVAAGRCSEVLVLTLDQDTLFAAQLRKWDGAR